MAKRKPCVGCGTNLKMRGNARYCHECWLRNQSVEVRGRFAEQRRLAIPEPLHLKKIPPERIPDGWRWCPGCQSFILVRDFSASSSRCRDCVATRARESRLEREYSLSPEEYKALFEAQGGRCYLCRRRSHSKPLAPDHDHKTGEVRGLLCPDPDWGCNVKILARFDADPDPVAMAMRLVTYLTNPPARKILQALDRR